MLDGVGVSWHLPPALETEAPVTVCLEAVTEQPPSEQSARGSANCWNILLHSCFFTWASYQIHAIAWTIGPLQDQYSAKHSSKLKFRCCLWTCQFQHFHSYLPATISYFFWIWDSSKYQLSKACQGSPIGISNPPTIWYVLQGLHNISLEQMINTC